VTDTDGLVNVLVVQYFDYVCAYETGLVVFRRGGLIGAAIAQHVRDDQAISLLLEEEDLMTPVWDRLCELSNKCLSFFFNSSP
jgi:hypothetical protein